jgi:DNA-binding response OmpR family regulator
VQVLIADDEPVHLFLLEMFLKKWGYKVVSTDDGTQAWRILQTGSSPLLAVLDWQLPGMDGVEICRAVRTGQRYKYILLLTARAQKTDILKGMEAGADAYLTKPYEPNELRDRLQAASQRVSNVAGA